MTNAPAHETSAIPRVGGGGGNRHAAPTAGPAQAWTAEAGTLVVEVRDVNKHFGSVPALSNLTMLVPQGRITVLLGPNGAGKTTAIRVITGALEPDKGGRVRTFGYDPAAFGEFVRRQCGVVSAKPALYDRLSGWDNMQYSAELYGLGRNASAKIRDAAGRFGILEALDQRVGGYSTGMKTRLALARSVLHDPQLLLFDEPTSGLDPESSRAVLDLIREMTSEGRTVVMCTHLLIEAEGLADQIIVLEAGTDLLHGSQRELIDRYWPNQLVWIEAEDPAQLDLVQGLPGVLSVSRTQRLGSHDGAGPRPTCEVAVDDVARVPDIIEALVAKGVRLTKVDPHQPTLEELYFAVRNERREQFAEDEARRAPAVASGHDDEGEVA